MLHLPFKSAIGLLFLFAAGAAHAIDSAAIDAMTDPAAKGRAIAEAADQLDTGFGDSEAEMTMELTNRQGQTSTRSLRMKSLEDAEGGEDKGMVVFDQPRDVAGTALLTHTKPNDDDEQWLYLPALSRVKRISGSNQTGSFMGSEFTYEDFSSNSLEKFTYEALEDVPCETGTCWQLERVPTNPKSGYSRQVATINKENFQPLKVDFYNKRDELQKTMTISEYKLYENKFWRAHRLHMVNHANGKATLLLWGDISFHNGLEETDFSRNALKRAR